MSLKHVLLGCLYKKPATGFRLKQMVDGSISHFWSAELSQIYPTLKKMQQESLVTCNAGTRDKVYHITDTGRGELLQWLRSPTELAQQRDAFMVKVYFGSLLRDEEVSRVIDDCGRRHRARIAEYTEALELGNSMLKDLSPHEVRDFRIKLLTLRAGIESEKHWASWCDEAAAEVAQMTAAVAKGKGEKGAPIRA